MIIKTAKKTAVFLLKIVKLAAFNDYIKVLNKNNTKLHKNSTKYM